MRSVLALALVASLAGCTPQAPADYLSVLPDDRVQISMPLGEAGYRDAGDWSPWYVFTATVTRDVNALIGGVLLLVDVVTDYPPTWSSTEENTAVWGPYAQALDPAETILWVHYEVEDDTYEWGFSQRPKGETSDESWVGVIAGHVDAGATHEASSGWFAMDFDAAATLDPRVTARGVFGTEYDIAPEGVSATAAFDAFVEEGSPIDAYYHYEQIPEGAGKMDLAWLQDLNGNGTAETVVLRSRWEPTGAGRGDGYVAAGDLGDTIATGSECWDESFSAVFHEDTWSIDGTTGDETLCAYAEPEYAPDDAAANP